MMGATRSIGTTTIPSRRTNWSRRLITGSQRAIPVRKAISHRPCTDTVGEAQESQLYVSILDDLNDAPDEVRACWDESTGIWDDLYEAGYTGIDMNLDDLLSRSSFNVNLFFATETEKNFDMGSIVDSFGNDYREPRLEDIDAESLDNALSYLVNLSLIHI